MRKLIDMAIAAGRKMQSPQTGFIHRYYNSQDDEPQLTIPLLENFLFALALFRSRTSENVTEAKSLIERLLPFQNIKNDRSHGNFPVYIHDYPKCQDWCLGLSLLAPMYWILQQFHHILGKELKEWLEAAAHHLLNYGDKLYHERTLPVPVALKFAAAAKAFGIFWRDQTLEAKGEELLRALASAPDRTYWGCPAALGSVLSSLQMAYPDISTSPWAEFLHYIEASWHPQTCSFIGPVLREFQQEFEPHPTLYDLYLGMIKGTFSSRALQSHQHLLEAALVHPFEASLGKAQSPMPFGSVVHRDLYAFSMIERQEGWDPAGNGAFQPFRLLWGTPQRVHTFTCQGGNVKSSTYKWDDSKIDLIFDLDEQIPEEDKEKSREIAFYLDSAEQHKILVDGIPATTFKLGDVVHINSPPIQVSVKFTLEEGKGQFMGHIMKGNRPAQVANKGKNRYNAFDWQILLRTIQRTGKCRLRAELTIQPGPGG